MRALRLSLIGLMVALSFSGVWAADLLVFSRPHCPPCEWWEAEVGKGYTATPVERVGIQSPRADELFIRVTPTFILLDGGKVVAQLEGYYGKKKFYEWLEKALKKCVRHE